MPIIIIASENPVKIEAVKKAFTLMLPGNQFIFTGLTVPSGVSNQPLNDQETKQGAINRLNQAKLVKPQADYWVGLEGGVEQKEIGLEAFAWIVIQNKTGQTGQARTASFYLPPQIATLIKQGLELGEADDQVFGQTNSKQQNGAVGILTNNLIDRATYYQQAVTLALIPFTNPNLYPLI
ncbi:inosine/xanthosine triphosphatase [Patescibacteria group bacterium]|nr:inosine/xanthosine triphosphatase [Patescibacteria group bacterium]